jgi:hypothetical protein
MQHEQPDDPYETKTVVWEHPTYGEARVTYGWGCWVSMRDESERWWFMAPMGVEFDLFTPEGEQEVLIAELRLRSAQGPNWPNAPPTFAKETLMRPARESGSRR